MCTQHDFSIKIKFLIVHNLYSVQERYASQIFLESLSPEGSKGVVFNAMLDALCKKIFSGKY